MVIHTLMLLYWRAFFVIGSMLVFTTGHLVHLYFKNAEGKIAVYPRWEGLRINKNEMGIGVVELYFNVHSSFNYTISRVVLHCSNIVTLQVCRLFDNLEDSTKTTKYLRFFGEVTEEQYQKLLELARNGKRVKIEGEVIFSVWFKHIEKSLHFEHGFVDVLSPQGN